MSPSSTHSNDGAVPTEPTFAVVGRVNRGKSSIVSTLAADDSVHIEARPGTTRKNRRYPLRIGDRTIYTLVDTPGFERARHVLAWLRQHETTTADRPEVVRRFMTEHKASGAYPQECELLEPILQGAAILYVVDSSVPFSPAYEAETEILRWTGQPRMALINPIGTADYTDQWHTVLDQYFSLVRVFDAHQADFDARIDLLAGLRELVLPWRDALDEGIRILRADRRHRIHSCAEAITDALIDLVTAREDERLTADASPEAYHTALAERFYRKLERREQRLHAQLRQAFAHELLEISQDELGIIDEDLFDTSTWTRLGLTRTQLAATGAAAGALLGGSIDLATGGSSLLTGAALGSVLGFASTWGSWGKLASVRVLGQSLGGKLLRIGPIRDPNFPWIILDRCLLLFAQVSRHPHARREPIELAARESHVQSLPASRRRPLETCFARLRRSPDDPEARARAREELLPEVEKILEPLATSQPPRAMGLSSDS